MSADPVWLWSGRSESAAWTALNGPYRDAVLANQFDDAATIMAEEIGPDAEYVGRSRGHIPLFAPRFTVEEFPDGADPYDDDPVERPMTADEAMAWRIETAALWRRIDWMKWVDPSTLTSLAEIYKRRYTDAAIADLSTMDHPVFSRIRRST